MISNLIEKETLSDISFIYSLLTAFLSMALCIIICVFLIKMYSRLDAIFKDL
ncbi:hypothetical protein [Flavobacterium sp.]|uniref:hypothetical protein n=1 Tax=Flavobacterium sp. TaxID=239 RepID=UPI0037536A2D